LAEYAIPLYGLRVHQKPERLIALEGNPRTVVFKLLTNPAVMSGLEMPSPMKTILGRLATYNIDEPHSR